MKLHLPKSFVTRKVYLLSALLFLVFFSCKDDGELVPQFNAGSVNIFDTVISVTSSTVQGDSLRTDRVSRNLLGKVNDPIYGLSTAEFYTQFYMPDATLNIPEDFVSFDSIILELAYDEYFGYDYEQDVMVYELTEALDDLKSYYSNHYTTASEVLVGSTKLKISQTDSFGSDTTHILRIKMDDEIGQRVVSQRNFANQAAFTSLIKGFKFTTDPNLVPDAGGDGAIVYFNLTSSKTVLKMYYIDTENNIASLNFKVDPSAQRYSSFKNELSETMKGILKDSTQTTNYISALAGVRTKITFDNMAEWASQAPIGINKAELVITFEDQTITTYIPPDKLTMIMKDPAGSWVLPVDFSKQGSEYFGGNLELSNKEYRFNLANTFHEIINGGDIGRALYLTISGGSVEASRFEINSGVHSTRKMYLVLTYSKSS